MGIFIKVQILDSQKLLEGRKTCLHCCETPVLREKTVWKLPSQERSARQVDDDSDYRDYNGIYLRKGPYCARCFLCNLNTLLGAWR